MLKTGMLQRLKMACSNAWHELVYSERGSIDFGNEDQDTGLPVDLGPDDGNYDERQEFVDPQQQQAQESDKAGQAGDEPDLSQPMFEYEDVNGKVISLTGQQVLDLIEKQNAAPQQQAASDPLNARIQELQNEIRAIEQRQQQGQQQSQPGQPSEADIAKYDEQIGNQIGGMLEGEFGGLPALGKFFRENVAALVEQGIQRALGQQNEQQSVEQAFTRDFPDIKDTLVNDKGFHEFMRSRQGYQLNPIEGAFAYRFQQALKQIEDLKSGADKAKVEGEKAGEQKAIKNLKARGTLRSVGGGARGASFQQRSGKVNVNDEAGLQSAALAALQAVRSQQAS